MRRRLCAVHVQFIFNLYADSQTAYVYAVYMQFGPNGVKAFKGWIWKFDFWGLTVHSFVGCKVHKVPGLKLHRCLVLPAHIFFEFMVHRLPVVPHKAVAEVSKIGNI